ncbi:MAG TPA: DinB family protein [Pyrinomonadaceae bacterium]|jgi:hypothetical protein
MIDNFAKLYDQGLTKLRTEVEKYPDEIALWKKGGNIPNSAGNLALHLIGNLNHFFGATIGGSDYVRDRENEFASSEVSIEQLLNEIDTAKAVVKDALGKLDADDLDKIYPVQFQNEDVSTEYVLGYLLGHLNYHLGQIDYHRRLLVGEETAAKA